ncbi:HutD family protein [Arthrobacter sp. GCM10027362]|uniref:HutD/Ves family protein n=1 Tax=Arthrobacter sp. GCM10027362 TaxID=3273379 RepID=UPI003632F389
MPSWPAAMQRNRMQDRPPARIVRPQQLVPSAWANGRGRTRVISRRPDVAAGETAGGFIWRLSLAELEADADFSTLPGIDRVFVLATTGPVIINVESMASILKLGQAARFPGEASVTVTLPAGSPQLGLNLMTRQDSCTGELSVEFRDGEVHLDPDEGVISTMVLAGRARLIDGRTLKELDTLVMGDEAQRLTTHGALLATATVLGC